MNLPKTILIVLTFGFLSIICMATESIYEDNVGDDKRSKTPEQITEERSVSPQRLVFSGEPLLNIGLYLGRQEVGRLEQVSRGIRNFFNENLEGLRLYETYAYQLHLENDSRSTVKKNEDNLNYRNQIKSLKKQVERYYELSIFSLINNYDLRFMDIFITCSNFDRSVFAGFLHHGRTNSRRAVVIQKDSRIKRLGLFHGGYWSEPRAISADGTLVVGWAIDGRNDKHTAVMWRDGEIESLGLLHGGHWSMAKAINADGKIIVGSALDGQNGNRQTAVVWEDKKITSLGLLNKKDLSEATSISANGEIIMGWAWNDQNNSNPKTAVWENKCISHLTQLNNGELSYVTSISGDGKIIVGAAWDGQNDNKHTAVVWEDKKITSLGLLHEGDLSEATSISGDGKIIAGSAFDGQNNNKETAVVWNSQGLLSLQDYPFKDRHDYLKKVIAVSSNGSDFIIKSDGGDIYKAHIPRDDLWKMR